jgi:hypothetical protein
MQGYRVSVSLTRDYFIGSGGVAARALYLVVRCEELLSRDMKPETLRAV